MKLKPIKKPRQYGQDYWTRIAGELGEYHKPMRKPGRRPGRRPGIGGGRVKTVNA